MFPVSPIQSHVKINFAIYYTLFSIIILLKIKTSFFMIFIYCGEEKNLTKRAYLMNEKVQL